MIRPTMLLISLLAVSLGVTLFVVKYQVQDLEQQLTDLNRAITEDRQAIHVLKAEWSHLNEPTRLKDLAERYLGLEAVKSRQIGTAADLMPRIPEIPPAPPAPPAVTPLPANVAIERPAP